MLRLPTLLCITVLGLSTLAVTPAAFGADTPAAQVAPAAAKAKFSLDRIHKELCRDIKLDREQSRTLRQARIDDTKKYDAFRKEHKKEFSEFEQRDRDWKKANHDALNDAKKNIKTAKKSGEAAGIAAAEEAYKKLLDSRPQLPAKLERPTFDPDEIIPSVKAVMHAEQMKEFEANIKALKRMQGEKSE